MRTEPNARFYELMSISVPDGTPEELIETSEAVGGYVTAVGGRILRSSNESPWGRRRLAYPIRHNSADLRDGIYTLYHFEIEPNRIEDIEREIRLNERIIRHLLLQLKSEPIFVEEVEEVTAETDPVTGETVVTDETIIVAESAAAGEVEVADEVEAVADDVDVAIVDASGDVEVVAEDAEVAVVDADGEAEIVAEEVEVAPVDGADEIDDVADEVEVKTSEEE